MVQREELFRTHSPNTFSYCCASVHVLIYIPAGGRDIDKDIQHIVKNDLDRTKNEGIAAEERREIASSARDG
jgi:hypothetical protein